MSSEEDEFIREIRRFVTEKRETSSSTEPESSSLSESESSSLTESESYSIEGRSAKPISQFISCDSEDAVKSIPQHISSDSEDDYFKIKERAVLTVKSNTVTSTPIQVDLNSDSEWDILKNTNKQDLQVVSTGSSISKTGSVGPRKRLFKRKRRSELRGEKQRVDESVKRAKEKFQERTISGQGEWRQSKTFGLGVEGVNRSGSKENSLLPDQEKSEVQDFISYAVGEPCLSNKLSMNDGVSDLPVSRPSSSTIHSCQSLRNIRKIRNPGDIVNNDSNKVKKFPVDLPTEIGVNNSHDSSPKSENLCENWPFSSNSLSTTVLPTSSAPSEKDDDDQEMLSLESCPRFQTSSRIHEGSRTTTPLPYSSPDTPKLSSSCSSGSSGFRDTSKIPKSPWFRGKTPGETSEVKTVTSSSLKKLSVAIIPVEHFVHFSDLDTPYILLNGSMYTIEPEQWLEILEVASVKASLEV